MKETKPQIGYTDALILMEALWRDSTGGATYKDLIATFDGFQKIPLLQDDLASGLICLEGAGLIRFTGERVIPTEKARALYSKIQEIRNSPDYGADPTRYGGEKLARIVASGATKAYEEFELLSQALSREYAMRPMGPGGDGGGGPRHPLYSEELYRRRRRNSGRVRAGYGGAQRKKVQEEPGSSTSRLWRRTEEICHGLNGSSAGSRSRIVPDYEDFASGRSRRQRRAGDSLPVQCLHTNNAHRMDEHRMIRIEDLAQQQLDAYNNANLDKFVACYHPDVRVFNGNEHCLSGIDAFRARYQTLFDKWQFAHPCRNGCRSTLTA